MGMIEDLNKLGKEIESAKTSVATLEGRRSEVIERLKTEHGISTIEEADKLLIKLDKEIVKMDAEIQADFTKLKENFSW